MILGDILVPRLDKMTIQTGDVGICMAAPGTERKNSGSCHPVAFDTGLGFRRYAALNAVLLNLGVIGLGFGKDGHPCHHERSR